MSHKTPRTFQCKDELWELFEVMARDLGCSMDYLINEAMRAYAQTRHYSVQQLQGNGPQHAQAPMPQRSLSFAQPPHTFEHRTFERLPAAQPLSPSYHSMPAAGYVPASGQWNAAYPPPPPLNSSMGQGGASRPASQTSIPQPPAPQSSPKISAPPPPPPPPVPVKGPEPMVSSEAPTPGAKLSIEFDGKRYPVLKDKFIIGRASQMTDLTIRDGSISRKHCAIIYKGGNYYIKDLGSTNGIEYQGRRIEAKMIKDGDVITVCDHVLKFIYR